MTFFVRVAMRRGLPLATALIVLLILTAWYSVDVIEEPAITPPPG